MLLQREQQHFVRAGIVVRVAQELCLGLAHRELDQMVLADLRVEQTGGFPTLELQFNRDAIARYGLSIEEVANTVVFLASRGEITEPSRLTPP